MPSPKDIDRQSLSSTPVVVRVIGVRLRFLLVMGALALLMAGWPWVQAGWERWVLASFVAGTSDAVSVDSEFFCPMDPGIISAWPAICPICNMELITRKKTDAVILPEGVLARMQLSPYRIQLAGVRTEAVQMAEGNAKELVVPALAVVHRDNGPIVYVETMTGMYDALPVTLGARRNEQYEVLSGLKEGQRVVSVGAFLIDAETRLNPSVATQYFGANTHQAASTPPVLATHRMAKNSTPLSPAEQQLIAAQRICPVTEAPLGSMGTPVFVTVDGQKVALCCQGCEAPLMKDKAGYLKVLKANKPREQPSP